MDALELQQLLGSIDAHIEVVVGDPDTGIYSEPRPKPGAFIRLWKLVQTNPDTGTTYTSYFAKKTDGEREQATGSLTCLVFQEVECLRL